MKNFLNQSQISELTEKIWEVRPKCFYSIFYKDEFRDDTWVEMCKNANVSPNCSEIKLLCVGVATK